MRGVHKHREGGQELVEFAIVAWLLILIAFGVIDLGRAFHAAVVISNAAREGARYGMAHPADIGGAQAAALLEAQSSGISIPLSAVAISCQGGSCVPGNWIRATVNYRFTLIWGFVLPNPDIDLSRYVEMLIP